MANKTGTYNAKIYIDGVAVENSVKSIKEQMRQLTNEQALMIKGSDDYIRQTRKIAQLDSILQDHKDYQKEVSKEYSKMSSAAEDFEKKSKKAFSLDSIASGINKLKGAIVGFIASFTVDKAVGEFAKLDDAQANVRKYTGQTKEEIKELNKEFDSLDTRTAQIRLNELAGDAGRLGKTSSKDILEFVDAANIIDVALGDDLGEGAIKSIGKLAEMFGNADKMGLRGAMLAIGSAINEVAQNSSAAEPYLVDFTNRLSGVGNQAGFTVSQIIGLGSVLDQNAQQVETSATALSGLIMKIYQQPAKFAKIAGLDVKEFTDMMKKDANDALLTLLDTLGKQGGLDKLAPIFKDMNLNGARSSSILSVLAGNIEKVRTEQKIATDAFAEGTSVIDEYNIQNNTFSANMDKQKKVLLGYVTSIGEKLAPMVLEGASAGNMLMKTLTSLFTILIDNKKAVLTVVGAYLAYNLLLKLHNGYLAISNTLSAISKIRRIEEALATTQSAAAQALFNKTMQNGSILTKAYIAVTSLLSAAKATLAGNTSAAGAAMQRFFSIVKFNPYVALLVAIPLVFKGIASLNEKFSQNGKEMSRLKEKTKNISEATEQYNKEISKEHSALTGLLKAIIDTDNENSLRRDLINDLKKQYPDLLKHINTEKISNNQLLSILKSVNKEYEKRYEIVALKAMSDVESKEIEAAKIRQIQIRKILALFKEGYTSNSVAVKEHLKKLNEGNGWLDNNIDTVSELQQEYVRLDKQIKVSIAEVSNYSKEIAGMEADINKSNTIDGVVELMNRKAIEMENERKAIESMKEHKIANKHIQSSIKNLEKLEAEYDNLADKYISLQDEASKNTTPTNSDDNNNGKEDKAAVQRKKINDALRVLEEQHYKDMSVLKEKYLKDDTITEDMHNQEVLKQQEIYDQDRKKKLQELLKSITDPSLRIDIAKQIAEIDAKALDRQIADRSKKQKNAAKQEQDLLKWNEEETKKILKAALSYVATEEDKAYIKQMQLRTQGKISEAEYQKEITNIQMRYLEERLRINGLTEEQIAEIRKQILDKEVQTLQKTESMRQSLFGNDIYLQLTNEMKSIDEALLAGAVTFGEAIMLRVESYLSAVDVVIQQIGGNISGAMSNFASAEESAVSRKYDKQIAAAEGNAKKQKKLEEKKQKELNAIKAKYADKQFAVQVAMTVSSTALAAMQAYAAMASIPIVGPALGVVAAGAAVAYGASQIAVAKEQRDAAKEGYFDGGFTGGVDPKEVRGYLPDGSPYHGMEFFANRHATANPTLAPMWNMIDEAQKHGTAGSLTKADLAKALHIPMGGYMQGGFSGSPAVVYQNTNDTKYNEVYERFTDMLERLEDKMDTPFKGYVTYKGDDGIEEAEKLNKKMIDNISRS